MLVLHLIAAFSFLFGQLTTEPTFTQDDAQPIVSTDAYPLHGTVWRYEDDDLSYTISFDSEGKLITTHPFDTTPANDTWKQEDGRIVFFYNNAFSTYEGTLVSESLMVGTAKNGQAAWSWRAYRIDVL